MRINKISITIFTALCLLLTGCSTVGGLSNASAPANDSVTEFSKEESSEVIKETRDVSINSDIVWGLGKTFDEVSEKYGEITEGGQNTYSFEKGYGVYAWDDTGIDPMQSDRDANIETVKGNGGCRTIGEIPAEKFLNGDISTVNMNNIAEKCGFEVVPLNPTDARYTMYDGYKFAYYTHPSYKGVTFSLCCKKSGFDKEAAFRVSFDTSAENEHQLSRAECEKITELLKAWGDLDYNIHPDNTNTETPDLFPECVDSSRFITEEITPRGSIQSYTEYFYLVASGDFSTEDGFNKKLDGMFTEKFKEQYLKSSSAAMFRFKDSETYTAGFGYLGGTKPEMGLRLNVKSVDKSTVETSVSDQNGGQEYKLTLIRTGDSFRIDGIDNDDGGLFGIPWLFHFSDPDIAVCSSGNVLFTL